MRWVNGAPARRVCPSRSILLRACGCIAAGLARCRYSLRSGLRALVWGLCQRIIADKNRSFWEYGLEGDLRRDIFPGCYKEPTQIPFIQTLPFCNVLGLDAVFGIRLGGGVFWRTRKRCSPYSNVSPQTK